MSCYDCQLGLAIREWDMAAAAAAKSLQSRPTLCNPLDCSQPGSSVHGTLQARILEWVAMPSCKGSSQPRHRTCVSYIPCLAGGIFTAEPPGKPEREKGDR